VARFLFKGVGFLYAQGAVLGENQVGGIVGHNCLTVAPQSPAGIASGNLTSLFIDGEGSCNSEQSGDGVSTALPTSQMRTQASFAPSWNFVTVWTIAEGQDYPRLAWE
jgi:hypothetical protein